MVETSLLKDKETELKHNYVDQQQELTNTIIPNNFEINKDNFSNKKNTEDFLKLCKSEEVTKRNFIYKIQQDFNNFSLKKKPDPIKQKLEYEEYVNQIKQIQTYGKLELDENISIDGEVGPQTRIIIESLQNLNNFSPQVFSNKISAILKQSNSQTREKIKQKLLQQAKESISDDNKEQRETYILTLKKGENVVAEQIYGHLFLDEKILVDGIVGEQTREIQAIIK